MDRQGKSSVTTARWQSRPGYAPSWAWVANWIPTGKWKLRKREITMWSNAYAKAFKDGSATGISDETRDLAYSICLMHSSEARLEQRLLPLLANPIFKPYHRVFNKFHFGSRTRAWIPIGIFPFSKFLKDGKPIIDYTMGAEKKDPKHLTKKNRTLRRFRQSLGLGNIERQSGKTIKGKSKAKGSGQARSAIWLFVNNQFEKAMDKEGRFNRKPGGTPILDTILEYWMSRAYTVLPNGKLMKVEGKERNAALAATMRRVAGLLYSELLNELSD